MRKIYVLILILVCLSSQAQVKKTKSGNKTVLPHYVEAIESLKSSSDGANWTYKTIDELLSRNKSPQIILYKNELRITEDKEYKGYRIEVLDLCNNNLNGSILNSFFYNPKWIGLSNWTSGKVSIKLSHNHITDINDLMCFGRHGSYIREICLDNNAIEVFEHKQKFPTGKQNFGGVGRGARIFNIHQNEITSLKREHLSNKSYTNGIADNIADTIRFDNNRLDITSLRVLVSTINNLTDKYSYQVAGNPNIYFDYMPQKPLGGDYSEGTYAEGTFQTLNFESSESGTIHTWQLNGKDVPLTETKSNTFELSKLSAGVWRCKMTHAALPGVEVFSRDMGVFIKNDKNKAATDIQFKQNQLSQNFPENVVVGDFSGVDPDGDQLYYRLPDKTADNSHFRIKDAITLVSAETLFEKHYIEKYDIEVEAYDIYGNKFTKKFEINKNTTGGTGNPILPTDIKLSKNSIKENLSNTSIGDFTVSCTLKTTLSLDDSEKDNRFFKIEDKKLIVKDGLNFESKNRCSIRVKATTEKGLSIKKDFEILVINVNDKPDDILLSNNRVRVNTSAGKKIAVMSALDQDESDEIFTYGFAEGYDNNSDFFIKGSFLYVKKQFLKTGTKVIGIETTDPDGAKFVKEFSIIVFEEDSKNIAPTGFGISNCVVNPDMLAGDVIGTLYMNDSEGKIGTFMCENEYAEIQGSKLRLKKLLPRNSCVDVVVKCVDGNYTILNTFTLFSRPDELNHKPRGFGLVSSNITKETKVGDIMGTFYMSDTDGSIGVFKGDCEFLTIEGSVLKLKKIPASGEIVNIDVSCIDMDFTITTTFTIANEIPALNTKPSGMGLTGSVIGKDMKKDEIIGSLILSDAEGNLGEFTCTSEYVEIVNRSLRLKKKPTDTNSISVEITADDGEFTLSQMFILTNELETVVVPPADQIIRGFGLTSTVISANMKPGNLVANLFSSENTGVEGTFTCDNDYLEISGSELRLKSMPELGTNFDIRITCSNGVSDMEQVFTFYAVDTKDVVTGIHPIDENNDLIIYPNPVTDYLQIKGIRSNSSTNYIIYNVKGVVVKNTNKLPIDVQNLSSGTYILKFSGDDIIESRRFIKK